VTFNNRVSPEALEAKPSYFRMSPLRGVKSIDREVEYHQKYCNVIASGNTIDTPMRVSNNYVFEGFMWIAITGRHFTNTPALWFLLYR
jgi:hypothetical protein